MQEELTNLTNYFKFGFVKWAKLMQIQLIFCKNRFKKFFFFIVYNAGINTYSPNAGQNCIRRTFYNL